MDRQNVIAQIMTELTNIQSVERLQQILAFAKGNHTSAPPPTNGQAVPSNTETMSREEFMKKLRG